VKGNTVETDGLVFFVKTMFLFIS